MHARFVYKPRDDVSLVFILIQMFRFHYRGHLLWDACEAALFIYLFFNSHHLHEGAVVDCDCRCGAIVLMQASTATLKYILFG